MHPVPIFVKNAHSINRNGMCVPGMYKELQTLIISRGEFSLTIFTSKLTVLLGSLTMSNFLPGFNREVRPVDCFCVGDLRLAGLRSSSVKQEKFRSATDSPAL